MLMTYMFLRNTLHTCNTCMHACTQTNVYALTQFPYIHTHAYTHTHTHVYIQLLQELVLTLNYTHTHIHTYIHTYIRGDEGSIHACIHTYIQTHMYAYSCYRSWSSL